VVSAYLTSYGWMPVRREFEPLDSQCCFEQETLKDKDVQFN